MKDGRNHAFEQQGRNRADERYDSRDGSRAGGDARARRRVLGRRGPADNNATQDDANKMAEDNWGPVLKGLKETVEK